MLQVLEPRASDTPALSRMKGEESYSSSVINTVSVALGIAGRRVTKYG
jgi:hypothetical protein